MTRVFISQPMKDLSEEEILENRKKITDLIMTKYNGDVEIVDSYIEEKPPEGSNPGVWYLGKSIELLATADAIALAPGWSDARGCKIEYKVATEYELTVLTISRVYDSITSTKYINLHY